MKKQTLTELLALRCAGTQKPIEAGEVVRLYDWGRERKLLGYGAFVWDAEGRKFYLENNAVLNNHYGFDFQIEDAYDLFRTTPEKLNSEEKKIISIY